MVVVVVVICTYGGLHEVRESLGASFGGASEEVSCVCSAEVVEAEKVRGGWKDEGWSKKC